jgi:hypothetical protein
MFCFYKFKYIKLCFQKGFYSILVSLRNWLIQLELIFVQTPLKKNQVFEAFP